MAEDLKAPQLKLELQKRGADVRNINVQQMREKLGDLLDPERVARREKMQEADKKAEEEEGKKTCEMCGSPGSIEKASQVMVTFTLKDTTKVFCHRGCAKSSSEILSSTEARKFLGPSLFAKYENTPDLPEGWGGYCSYGSIRYFRKKDLMALQEANPKVTKRKRTEEKKAGQTPKRTKTPTKAKATPTSGKQIRGKATAKR
jgi:hypothetical protein